METKTKRKIRIGQVVSTKMDKTAVVVVETARRHPIYKKTVKKEVKYMFFKKRVVKPLPVVEFVIEDASDGVYTIK